MDDFLLGLLVGIFVGFFIGGFAGIVRTSARIEKQAVEAHAAEYYLDQDNMKKFRYISTVKN